MNFLLNEGQTAGFLLTRKVKCREWDEMSGIEIPVPMNMFVTKRNISGKVDILLAVLSGEYNNAFQFFRMEIS